MTTTEHPRARGENWCALREEHWRARNIPAHAGKTIRLYKDDGPSQEHPRARGENAGERHMVLGQFGTSPRTRGKPPAQRRFSNPAGNIPAHAGKTSTNSFHAKSLSEHPRARGENDFDVSSRHFPAGTSPRTRGKQTPGHRTWNGRRNIPAHAGKTLLKHNDFLSVSEHPRARGENTVHGAERLGQRGTSPRTRGKRLLQISKKSASRNIPAHAGKTVFKQPLHGSKKEHPRARGENSTGGSHDG